MSNKKNERWVYVPGVGCAWVDDNPDAYMKLYIAQRLTRWQQEQAH